MPSTRPSKTTLTCPIMKCQEGSPPPGMFSSVLQSMYVASSRLAWWARIQLFQTPYELCVYLLATWGNKLSTDHWPDPEGTKRCALGSNYSPRYCKFLRLLQGSLLIRSISGKVMASQKASVAGWQLPFQPKPEKQRRPNASRISWGAAALLPMPQNSRPRVSAASLKKHTLGSWPWTLQVPNIT